MRENYKKTFYITLLLSIFFILLSILILYYPKALITTIYYTLGIITGILGIIGIIKFLLKRLLRFNLLISIPSLSLLLSSGFITSLILTLSEYSLKYLSSDAILVSSLYVTTILKLCTPVERFAISLNLITGLSSK